MVNAAVRTDHSRGCGCYQVSRLLSGLGFVRLIPFQFATVSCRTRPFECVTKTDDGNWNEETEGGAGGRREPREAHTKMIRYGASSGYRSVHTLQNIAQVSPSTVEAVRPRLTVAKRGILEILSRRCHSLRACLPARNMSGQCKRENMTSILNIDSSTIS